MSTAAAYKGICRADIAVCLLRHEKVVILQCIVVQLYLAREECGGVVCPHLGVARAPRPGPHVVTPGVEWAVFYCIVLKNCSLL